MKCADYFWSTLQIVLIVLKLCGVINSWWLVFIPVYINIVPVLIAFFISRL